MLRIKIYLAKSKIPSAGIGLFANEDISKGSLIWKWDRGLELEFESIKNLYAHPEPLFSYLTKYSFSHRGAIRVPIDEDKYMNHSSTPNIDTDGIVGHANQDIKKGDELTCDYTKLGPLDADKFYNSDI